MTLEEICTHLQRVEGCGNQRSALCPAHEDKHQSLSISTGPDGKILLHCHCGCSVQDIVNAMGLTMQDLFPEPLKQSPKKKARKLAVQYNYTDINGNFLNQKTRWETENGKTFTWSHKENGRWVKGHQGEPVLYNLPAAKADFLYIAEGEKDVDTLTALGFPAVCGAHGAGTGKWLPQYTKALEGKSVAILQDNDDVGKAFALETARSLRGSAKSVKLLDLSCVWPEIPNHGDITDMLEAMGKETGLSALSKLTEETPEFSPVDYLEQEADPEKPAPKFYNDNGKFLHNIMGDYLIKKYGACKINGTVHIYDGGVYRPGEDILHGYMLRMIPELPDAKRREVFKYVKVSLDTPVKQMSPPHLIPFRSRVYDVKADRFLEYSPDMVFLNRFPYDYDPAAPAVPLVDQTIQEISCGDAEIIKLILESFGNCFYMLNAFRGSVMLYGPNGSNGKSTLLNMLTQLLGKENASNLSIQDMAERFRLMEIYGKAANIGDDIPDTYLPDSSYFKKLVTGETVIGEKKGQDPIAFRPYAKIFFAMNGLPPVSDKSKAFFSRILLIPLNNDFSKQGNMDVSLKDRTWTEEEMAYLTRLSVEGLKRLLRQGNFTRPACVVEAVQQYEFENNPVAMFLDEYKNIIGEPTSSVYSDFKYWCWDNGHKNIMTQTKFVREARAVTGFITRDKRHPYFKGGMGKVFALPEQEPS